MNYIREQGWNEVLHTELNKPYFKTLESTLNKEYEYNEVFPPKNEIFRAFELTPLNTVKAVILGQDPYHGYRQACGLSFSVNKGIAIPKSLCNIFKELYEDLGLFPPSDGDLSCWAKEGVLLLNTVLTVKAHMPNSHKDIGWIEFTDAVIHILNQQEHPIVFILWGKNAQEKKILINNPIHYIIESAHPSPFSAYKGFFGSKPFSRTNEFLRNHNIQEIDWNLR